MSLNFELRRERHAIGEFLASIQLFQPVGPNTFAAVVVKLRELAEHLELPAEMRFPQLQLSLANLAEGALQSIPSPAVGFQRYAKDGEITASLACDSDSMTFVLRDYPTWPEVRPLVVDTFADIMEIFQQEIPAIQSIKVQYQNEFRPVDPLVRDTSELFRADSKWLAPFAHQSVEPWHCHIGQYLPVDENQRRLVNVNCNVAPFTVPTHETAEHRVKVLIVAGCYYNVPGGKPLILSRERLRQGLIDNFDVAHKLEKQTLREVISDRYLDAMGALNAD
jgi:uncharacterized protein (TIGR04255 family)